MKKFNIYLKFSILFLFVSIIFFVQNVKRQKKAEAFSKDIVEKFDRENNENNDFTIENSIKKTKTKGITMPNKKIGDDYYIGKIIIDSLNINLPVMEDWSEEKLEISPCRFSGNIYEKDMIILAHNFPAHFLALNEISKNAIIKFVDVDKNIRTYKVSDIEILEENQLDLLLDKKERNWDLTLFTCTYSLENRLVVRAKEI